MTDDRDDQPSHADLSDEALGKVLAEVAARQALDAGFRQRLGDRLRDLTSERAPSLPVPPVPRKRLNRLHAAAGLSFCAGAALVLALVARHPRPAMAPVMTTMAGDAAVTLRAPPGQRSGVAIQTAGHPLVAIELRDGAEITYRPAVPPRLELAQGFVRLATSAPLQILASGIELSVDANANLALELRELQTGGHPMRPLWLIPTSAGAGAALTLAVLVASGRVAVHDAGASTPLPAGQVQVLHPGQGVPPSQRRLAELEQRVSALKQENGRLAGRLAQKTGVTLEQVRERILGLSRTPLGGLLAPGAMTDVLTDLKGLGPAGVDAMIKLLKSPNSSERFLAAKLLEDLSAPAAIDALKHMALTEEVEMNANMASHALAFMDDPAALPALREIAGTSKSWGSQVNALWALCKHGDKNAIDQSLAWMKDEKRTRQARAALGANLMLLPDPELMAIVDQTLKDFGAEESVAAFAVTYYKNVGTPEGRERLESMANDPRFGEAVHKAARDALAGVSR